MRHQQQIDGDVVLEVARLAAGLHAEARKAGLPAFPMPRDAHRSRGSRRRRRVARATWRASKTLARQSYARRRPLAPIGTAVSLYVAGVIFAVSPHGANTVPLFAILVASVVWWRSRRRQWRAIEKWYAASVFAGAMGWLETASILGAGPPMPGVLGLAALVAAVPWWIHHRVRPHVPEYDDRIEVWDARVASQGGALPSSRLVDVAEVATGWSATIALPGGKLTTANALGATSRIASAYGAPSSSVVVEAPLTGEEHRARLLVLTVNPLREVQPFTGPQLDHTTGQFPIGPHADGTRAWWRLWTPGSGACHGLIAGTTGSGKSAFVNLLCTEIRHSGVVVLWLGDPEEGASVPDWQDAADWFAGGVPEIRRMLRAAEKVMIGRKKRRGRQEWTDEHGRLRRGRGHFEPTPDEPQLTVIIDESPDVMDDAVCARIIALIGKKGRKLGVGVVLIAQVPSVAELGGNVTVRSMVSSTNIVMFRTSDQFSGKMGLPQDLPVDPKNLPSRWPDGSDTAGLGYIAGTDGRVSPLRAMYVEDPYHWATNETPVVTLDAAAAADASEDYATWRERRAAGDDQLEDKPQRVPVLADAPVEPAAIPDDGPAPARRRGTARDAILTRLRQRGQIRTGVLAGDLDVPLPTVSSALRRLERDGHAVQVGHGVWAHIGDAPDEFRGDDETDVA